MIDAIRRKFLLNTLISSAAVGYFYQLSVDPFSEPEPNTGLSRELIAVFNQWIEMGLGDPEGHLAGIENELMDPLTLNKKIAADFENNNLFLIDGLVLSFTEAVVMSNLGLASLHREDI